MNQALLFQIPILIFLGLSLTSSSEVEILEIGDDTADIKVDTLYDASGVPDGYQAHVHIPVCEADKCYAIEIIFRWDLIGRFLDYDTIPGSGLTKLDHIPFTEADYLRLRDILKNENSPLASYEKDQLVKDTRTSEIDGFTGATIAEVKENVIEGAVYSCYTLWHIAYGPLVNELQQITYGSFDEEVVQKLVGLKDQQVNYFLINNLNEEGFVSYRKFILQTIADGNGYYPKNAIEKIPTGIFQEDSTQLFFAKEFEKLNYFAQVALLEKLEHRKLHQSMITILAKQLDERDSYRNDLIRQLLVRKD